MINKIVDNINSIICPYKNYCIVSDDNLNKTIYRDGKEVSSNIYDDITIDKDKIEDAIKVMKDGIKALNLKIGAAKGDIKVTKNGSMVGEIAARLSGGFMSAYTYPLSTGVNLIKNAIEIALGNPPSDLKPKWNKVSVEKAFLPGTGIIESIEYKKKDAFIFGVQWHPECMTAKDIKMQNIFSMFVDICK